jgi:ABC-type hemin transport system ATPase subunit
MVFKNLFRRKGRTILTIVGIAIGVAAIVALGAMADSMRAGYGAIAKGSKADLVLTKKGAVDITLSGVDEGVADQLRTWPEVAAVDGIVLADEPTGELDSERSREIISLMHRLNHELGTTFIVVTHDPNVARQTDRILILDSGRVVAEHLTTDPYAEDLRTLRDSPLGRALLTGTEADLVAGGVVLVRGGQPTEAGRWLMEILRSV